MTEETNPVVLSLGNYRKVDCCVCNRQFYSVYSEYKVGPAACFDCIVASNPLLLSSLFGNGVNRSEWRVTFESAPAETVSNGYGLELDAETESNNE